MCVCACVCVCVCVRARACVCKREVFVLVFLVVMVMGAASRQADRQASLMITLKCCVDLLCARGKKIKLYVIF